MTSWQPPIVAAIVHAAQERQRHRKQHSLVSLGADSPTQHAYDEHDINFLTGFANVLAGAVATQSRMQALRVLVEEKNLLAQDAMPLDCHQCYSCSWC